MIDPARLEAQLIRPFDKAVIRLEILTGRMRACREETGQHDLIGEAEAFCEEGRSDLEKIRALAAEAGWISVEDRLPEKSGFYLVYKGARISKKWYSSGVEPLIKFTHWQPLPPPPKPEAGRAEG